MQKLYVSLSDATKYYCTASGLKIFSNECNDAGCRKFVVARSEECWHLVSDTMGKQAYFHEQLIPGRRCMLYLDLEYSVSWNWHMSVDTVSQFLLDKLCELYPSAGLIFLSSCTPGKFSFHVISTDVVLSSKQKWKYVAKYLASQTQRTQHWNISSRLQPVF